MRKDDMMKNLCSSAIKLACGSALALAVLILHPGSWEQRAGARAKSTDPIMGTFFQVQVEGKLSGTFKACSGIGSVSEVIENRPTGKDGKQVVQKIPGRLKWSDVTLSRGLTTDQSLNQWRQEVIDGRVADARKKCTITVLNQAGQPMAVWDLNNAWPSGLIINQEKSGDPLVEEMTVTYESAVRRQ
jgi:phage tail-like protein